jgi:hypothetical protein
MNPSPGVLKIACPTQMLAMPMPNDNIGKTRMAMKAIKALAGIGAGVNSMLPFKNKKAMIPQTSPPKNPSFIVIGDYSVRVL